MDHSGHCRMGFDPRNFVEELYDVTEGFPEEASYGLASRIRQSCLSLPSRIDECYEKQQDADYRQFINKASGPVFELENQLRLAHTLDFLEIHTFEYFHSQLTELKKILAFLNVKMKQEKQNAND